MWDRCGDKQRLEMTKQLKMQLLRLMRWNYLNLYHH
jgi:hypothetical protein